MKTKPLILAGLGLFILVPSICLGWIVPDPTLTVFENGNKPKASTKLLPNQRIRVVLQNTSGNFRKIEKIQVLDDTLRIMAGQDTVAGLPGGANPMPPVMLPGKDTVTMPVAQLYQVWLWRTVLGGGMQKSKLGTFRVFPGLSTFPSAAAENTDFSIKLAIGYGNSCVPSYKGSLVRRDSVLEVSYRRDGTVCIDCFPGGCGLLPYGPSFSPRGLVAGTYKIVMYDIKDPENPLVEIGSIRVYERMEIAGRAHIMQPPNIKMMPRPITRTHVKIAREILSCSPSKTRPETLSAWIDTTGRFEKILAQTGGYYHFISEPKGFHRQTVRVKADAAAKTVGLELIPDSIAASTDLAIRVTYNGSPAESASVQLQSMPMVVCPAKAAKGPRTGFFGITDKNGNAHVSDLSLSPFIDYTYTARRKGFTRETKTGTIRLNVFAKNTLHIELGTADAVDGPSTKSPLAGPVDMVYSPTQAFVSLKWDGMQKPRAIDLLDVMGRRQAVTRVVGSNSVSFDVGPLSSGLYILQWKLSNGPKGASRFMITR